VDNKEFKNKEKLLEAALDEFGTHSYREASLNSIIKKAGVSKGSFYFNFKNKKSLYLYLFEVVGKIKIEFFNKHSTTNKDFAIRDIFELIKLQARLGMEFSAKFTKYYHLWLRFWKEEDRKIQEMIFKKFNNEFHQIIRPLIKKSIENGEFREDFDEDSLTRIISHFLINFNDIFPVDSKKVEDGLYLKEIDRYIDFLKNGLMRK